MASSTLTARIIFAVSLATAVSVPDVVEANSQYVFVNRTSHNVTINFAYCSGIIPVNGVTSVTLVPGGEYSMSYTPDMPAAWCTIISPVGAVWKGHAGSLSTGNGPPNSPPGRYELVDPPPRAVQKGIQLQPGEMARFDVSFDAGLPHEITIRKNGSEVKKFGNRSTGKGTFTIKNDSSQPWDLRVDHRFEQRQCNFMFIWCHKHVNRWVSGRFKLLDNGSSVVRFGFDDFPWSAVGEAHGDGDFNDAIVRVVITR